MNRILRINQLWQLTKSLFYEIIREQGVLFWGIVFPILMSLGLGLAFTQKGDITRKGGTHFRFCNNGEWSVTSFLNEDCEKNDSDEEGAWQYRFTIKNDKLGNSVFLFYDTEWEDAMKLLKRGTFNVLIAATPIRLNIISTP
jgi:ABC-2 type transport system permease protein